MPHIGITTIGSYAWSALTLFAFIGVAFYLLDRKWGVHIYRWQYDIRHRPEDRMPANVEKGFLYDQSTNRKVTVALFLASVLSLYMAYVLGWSVNLAGEIIIWLFEVPAMLLGFWAGSWVYQFLLRRNKYFDKADALADKVGHMSIDDVGETLKGVGKKVVSGVQETMQRPSTEGHVPEVAPAPPPAAPPADGPRDILERFTKGGRA